ncbi:MAG: aldehyde dehydrogenase family protein [Chryseobacterium sp.]|nr:MAG: aldehyde dehydrogenase family protein [Chryseobacterium sp.]
MHDQQNFERLNYLLEDAVQKGAVVELGGILKKESLRIHPTILTHVPLHAAIMQEEILGPIIPVYSYTTSQEAMKFIKQFDTPLTYYLFSESGSNINCMFDTIKSEGIFVNDLLPEAFQATKELSFNTLSKSHNEGAMVSFPGVVSFTYKYFKQVLRSQTDNS